jgi:hypothetical protein
MSGQLYLPNGNGSFEQKGKAKFMVATRNRVGPGFDFDLTIEGGHNDIMAMIYDSIKQRPEVAKMMFTVMVKFCQDYNIHPSEMIKHSYFAGQNPSL